MFFVFCINIGFKLLWVIKLNDLLFVYFFYFLDVGFNLVMLMFNKYCCRDEKIFFYIKGILWKCKNFIDFNYGIYIIM